MFLPQNSVTIQNNFLFCVGGTAPGTLLIRWISRGAFGRLDENSGRPHLTNFVKKRISGFQKTAAFGDTRRNGLNVLTNSPAENGMRYLHRFQSLNLSTISHSSAGALRVLTSGNMTNGRPPFVRGRGVSRAP